MSIDLVTAVEVAAAGVTVLAVVGGFIRWGWRAGRNIGRLVDAIIGEPAKPGFEARPGVLERMTNVESATTALGEQTAAATKAASEASRRVDAIEGLVHEIKGAVMSPGNNNGNGPVPA